jgi:hypothetical protein
MFPKTLKNSPKHKLYPCVPDYSQTTITETGKFSNLSVHGIMMEFITEMHTCA